MKTGTDTSVLPAHAFNMMIGFGESTVIRNSGNQYEFIPDEDYFTKFTEDQDRYHCVCNAQYANVHTVPVSPDAEFAGAVLEAMGWFAMPQLKEAVIDTSVLVKGMRDEDSYDMFMTIFDAKTYELIYSFNRGRYYSETTGMVISGTDNLSSVFAKVREATDTQMRDFIEAVRSDF